MVCSEIKTFTMEIQKYYQSYVVQLVEWDFSFEIISK